MGASRGLTSLLLALLIALLGFGNSADAAQASLEYAIKANFLYKFAPFVEWPATTFPQPASALTICAQGENPVSQLLDQVTAGQRIGARAILIKHLDAVDRNSGCHILYAVGTARQSAADALLEVKGLPVLTVTESASIPRAAGMINFVLQNNRVRFDIDDAAATESGISISSRLLTLARTLRLSP